MTHRAQEIVDAIASALDTQVSAKGWHTFTHRRETFQAEQDELPAYSVDFGEDQPTEQMIDGIWTGLSVVITSICQAPTEKGARELLLDMREQSDAVMETNFNAPAGQKLGLHYVHSIQYAGASAPEVDSANEHRAGSLSSSWVIQYRLR